MTAARAARLAVERKETRAVLLEIVVFHAIALALAALSSLGG